MKLQNAEVFAALAVPGIMALWKSATLRGEIRKEWRTRVEDAENGLNDRATRNLITMQQEISSLIGSGPMSLPRLATLDPTQLVDEIHDFQRTLETASRLRSYLAWLLRLGPILLLAGVLFLLGMGALFIDNSELASSDAVRILGLVTGGAGVALGAAVLGAWIFLHARLSGAEIRATEHQE